MISHKVLRSASQLFSILLLAFLATLLPSQSAHGQGLEAGGGWAYLSGDGGNGVNVDGAWWFNKRVTMALNYDSVWKNQFLGTFAFTQVGSISVKGHLQNLIVGPRIFFSTNWTAKHKLNPFGEAQFGVSWLSQAVNNENTGEVSASANHFTWELGGGADYLFSPHWSGRVNLDFLRTHFIDQGQSHLRFVLGVIYTFGPRGEAAH